MRCRGPRSRTGVETRFPLSPCNHSHFGGLLRLRLPSVIEGQVSWAKWVDGKDGELPTPMRERHALVLEIESGS
eukprot:3314110-Rhodomonas_salina.1